MLHYKNLNKLFFESVPQQATDFIALSGFLGPDPIKKLEELPFKSTIIYGLQKENQKFLLHQQLLGLHNDNRKIYYPDIACHSKCYLWLNGNTPIKGLIGSANFSSNGLYNDYRETLLEVDENQLYVMKGYIEIILNSARECNTVVVEEKEEVEVAYNREICEMILYDPRTGQTHNGHGLNWGFANANVRPNDACIPIRMEHIRKYPKLFPPLQPDPESRKGTLKEVVEYVWDDGVVMQGRLEGSQPLPNSDLKFPKQLASFPHKDELGIYIRERLNIPLGQRILREDLIRYGRDTVSFSLIEEGVYYLDFSV
tara:strand:- start:1064 stop:2002 length:939 start_codon:yes stop_codon:yes gene_type:complete